MTKLLTHSPENTRLFVMLHGLGASGSDFHDFPEFLALPATSYFMPDAPVQAVTINHGLPCPSWYDIISLSPESRSVNSQQLQDSVNKLANQILDLQEEHGFGQIILGGFSQGGAVAYHLGLCMPMSFEAVFCFSTYLPLVEQVMELATKQSKSTPFYIFHGEADEVVDMALGKMAHQSLIENGFKATFSSQAGLAHSISLEQLIKTKETLHNLHRN